MATMQWRINRRLERAERRLARVRAQTALCRQIDDINVKLKMLAEIKSLFYSRSKIHDTRPRAYRTGHQLDD
jgi:HAMP domain-containing protein